ncbi:uncharacterized protein LOC120538279 [Polypterus senegalus]|uniref:uncharacterized protein LOC120538279 n=1 Tax=Polypterus senegalus TaxID=55291 RepID=UPI001966AD50|nr:uncharacterized protein LOC120538279 [Polypterus senegalus]
MRELYQGVYEGSGDQLFYDPSDSWDADGACQSPRRRRSSLTRRYSDSCWDKAFRDVGSLVEPGCAAACKHLISTALEGLEVTSGTRHLLDKLLLDLCTIVDSVKTIADSYRDLRRISHGAPEKVPDPSIYLSAATSVYSMVTTLQICQMLITDVCVQKTHLKILSSEVKMLGGSLALLIHGAAAYPSNIRYKAGIGTEKYASQSQGTLRRPEDLFEAVHQERLHPNFTSPFTLCCRRLPQ